MIGACVLEGLLLGDLTWRESRRCDTEKFFDSSVGNAWVVPGLKVSIPGLALPNFRLKIELGSPGGDVVWSTLCLKKLYWVLAWFSRLNWLRFFTKVFLKPSFILSSSFVFSFSFSMCSSSICYLTRRTCLSKIFCWIKWSFGERGFSEKLCLVDSSVTYFISSLISSKSFFSADSRKDFGIPVSFKFLILSFNFFSCSCWSLRFFSNNSCCL